MQSPRNRGLEEGVAADSRRLFGQALRGKKLCADAPAMLWGMVHPGAILR